MAKSKVKHLQRLKLTNRRAIAVILVVSLLSIGVLVWARKDNPTPNSTDNTTAAAENGEYINYGPPTEEEKQQAEDRKNEIVAQNENQNNYPQTPSGKKQVTPVITGADNSNVRSYISGIVEDGGSCTATFTKGSEVVTRTSAGLADVSTTVCAPSTNLSPGSWKVVMSYASAKAEGKSQPYNLQIQ